MIKIFSQSLDSFIFHPLIHLLLTKNRELSEKQTEKIPLTTIFLIDVLRGFDINQILFACVDSKIYTRCHSKETNRIKPTKLSKRKVYDGSFRALCNLFPNFFLDKHYHYVQEIETARYLPQIQIFLTLKD
jgi:hypothetical protein